MFETNLGFWSINIRYVTFMALAQKVQIIECFKDCYVFVCCCYFFCPVPLAFPLYSMNASSEGVFALAGDIILPSVLRKERN